MNSKYIINGGLAFSEKKDIRKLEKYACKGWQLEKFAFGAFFYKLKKAEKKDLIYTMDFQLKPDNGYFEIFETAGWEHITSSGNQIHIFSAKKGTNPIYSHNEEDNKYEEITKSLGKGAFYSLIALIVMTIILEFSERYFSFLKSPLLIIALITLTSFTFCVMPYTMYKIKEFKRK